MARRQSGSALSATVTVSLLVGFAVLLGSHAVWVKANGDKPVWETATTTGAGLLFLLAGALRLRSVHTRSMGVLTVWVAVAAFAEDVQLNPHPWVHTIGIALRTASNGPLTHLVLAYPYGRLPGRATRVVTGAAYLFSVVGGLLGVAFIPTGDPPNLLLIRPVSGLDGAVDLAGVPLGVAVVVLLCRAWVASSRPTRQVLGPVLVTSLVTAAAALVAGLSTFTAGVYRPAIAVYRIGSVLVPLALLAGDLALHRQRAGTMHLLQALGGPLPVDHLQSLLRRTLRDPTLDLGIWQPRLGAFRHSGGTVTGPDTPARFSRARTVLTHAEVPVAVLDHDAAVLLAPDVLAAVATGVALHLRAEASSAAAAEVGRLERELHDGVQADLVAALATLRLARRSITEAGSAELTKVAHAHLDQAEVGVAEALADIRRLSHGVRPSILTEGGLVAAVGCLAARMPLTVEVDAPTGLAWGELIEATVFVVVAEALTNVVRHSGASFARVDLTEETGVAAVAVGDNGVGGARLLTGGGLDGLRRRVGAVGGQLLVEAGSPGTVIRARIPTGAS